MITFIVLFAIVWGWGFAAGYYFDLVQEYLDGDYDKKTTKEEHLREKHRDQESD